MLIYDLNLCYFLAILKTSPCVIDKHTHLKFLHFLLSSVLSNIMITVEFLHSNGAILVLIERFSRRTIHSTIPGFHCLPFKLLFHSVSLFFHSSACSQYENINYTTAQTIPALLQVQTTHVLLLCCFLYYYSYIWYVYNTITSQRATHRQRCGGPHDLPGGDCRLHNSEHRNRLVGVLVVIVLFLKPCSNKITDITALSLYVQRKWQQQQQHNHQRCAITLVINCFTSTQQRSYQDLLDCCTQLYFN